MARIKNGIMGAFEGKVGTVIGCTWKGISYMRSLPKKRTGKPTEKEISNRKRFADVQAWLKPLLPFVREGFKGYSPTVEGYVAAKSYLLRNAVEGEYPDFKVNPEKMKVSFGDLPLSMHATAEFDAANGTIVFSWDAANVIGTSPRDQVMMLAYCVNEKKVIFVTTGAFRQSGTDSLLMSNDLAGKYVEVYLAFTAADRSRQSNSIYLGSILCEG